MGHTISNSSKLQFVYCICFPGIFSFFCFADIASEFLLSVKTDNSFYVRCDIAVSHVLHQIFRPQPTASKQLSQYFSNTRSVKLVQVQFQIREQIQKNTCMCAVCANMQSCTQNKLIINLHHCDSIELAVLAVHRASCLIPVWSIFARLFLSRGALTSQSHHAYLYKQATTSDAFMYVSYINILNSQHVHAYLHRITCAWSHVSACSYAHTHSDGTHTLDVLSSGRIDRVCAGILGWNKWKMDSQHTHTLARTHRYCETSLPGWSQNSFSSWRLLF